MKKPKQKKNAVVSPNKPDSRVKSAKKDEDEEYQKYGGIPDRDLKKNLGCG